MTDVLIVDDDMAILEMVSAALELEGIPHRTAVNGEAALALVAERRPKVILLDINMPVMDGIQFCAALDATHGRDATAVVIMTAGREAPRFRDECAADDMLGKPFNLSELYDVVERHLTTA